MPARTPRPKNMASGSGKQKNQVAPLLTPLGLTLEELHDTSDTTVRGAEAVRKLQDLLEAERVVSLMRITEDPGNVRLGMWASK